MKLIIGDTGLIGTTLQESIKFDYKFNSSNLEELLNLEVNPNSTDLYLCCLPATKWLVNQNPSKDFTNMLNILNVISKKQYNTIVLYSTIDIYTDAPKHSDENYSPQLTSLNYGNNRYIFEELIRTTLNYNKLIIIRLPALFSMHLKKNIIFDILNGNNIDKVNYNSAYQWYNLENLTKDTTQCLLSLKKVEVFNIFSQPVPTSEILKIFDINKKQVDTTQKELIYDYKTNTNKLGYNTSCEKILEDISKFKIQYVLSKMKIAVCLFGEERNLLTNLQDWKTFQTNTGSDIFVALYSNENILNTIQTLKDILQIKSYYIADNDLQKFDKLKYKAQTPIHLYGIDKKATFNRITSQLYIREKAVSMIDDNYYDIILLCRSDISGFNISKEDLYKAYNDNNLLIVNSGTHSHPGGGGGCTKCSEKTKCTEKYHANDICDHWCVGHINIMKNWKYVYSEGLNLYEDIQKESTKKENTGVNYTENEDTNEIIFYPDINNINVIENTIHCYYPEKIMRSLFKDTKIIDATHTKDIWDL